jgi:hypothetical protein
MARRHNGRASTKITDDLARYILNPSTFDKWAGYSLKQRVASIKEDYDISIHITTLSQFYARNNVTRRVANYRY